MRIQTFIDARNKNRGSLTGAQENTRKAVVKGWWRLVLWYVRLRKAARGSTPTELLEVEKHIGAKTPNDPVEAALRADVRGYKPYYGEEGPPET